MKNHSNNPWKTIALFCFSTILLSVFFRVSLLDKPFFGNHLFRQLQTLSTIEAYTWDGIDLLHPRTNYAGYPGHMLLEFPIFQAIASSLSNLLKIPPLPVTKGLNLFLGILSAILVYRISRFFTDKPSSIIAAFIYFFAPLNLMYHASTLIDPMAVLGSLLATESFFRLSKNNGNTKMWTLILLVSSVLTVLIKPLYLFPLALLLLADGISILKSPCTKLEHIFLEGTKKLKIWIPVGVAGVVLLVWLMTSKKMSTGLEVMNHFGWKPLLNPSYYLTLFFRYCFYIQTPITLFLSIIALLTTNRKPGLVKTHVLMFFSLPFLYYIVFANMNRPHDYYSLILVPFLAILSGIGWDEIQKKLSNKNTAYTLALVSCVFISSTYLYFTNYWLTPNTTPRYQELARAAEEIGLLNPGGYSLVYIDKNGPFDLNEYLGESRRDLVKAKLGNLNIHELKQIIRPVYAPAVLYALNQQYGEMIWYQGPLNPQNLREKIETYHGNLEHLVICMPSKPEEIKQQLGEFKLQRENETLLVFEP